ncbi:O-glycosyl hydrolase [Microbacterium proteolyticum]|uniref:O-glycosyl hydrolase n=1 Tax=Microbacterium proteolyticum TaxID=1572644 RepID=A0A7W5CM30_9MICO|nr:glycoside hydrolase [Microbacterium proteolyticum]MBB3159424.1 O-glycosyl hydrolase [Microbacterium proteolyticum]
MKSPRLLSMTCAVALTAGVLSAGAAVTAPDVSHAATAPVRIAPNPATASEPFEGWGTSLVWFANATGNYPADVRQKLFDAVFGEDGLNLNIARYNIGGGNATDVPSYLRPGGAVPGFWNPDLPATDDKGAITSTYADRDRYKAAWNPDDPTHYDFTADSAQRWWIDALKGKVTHWEAFSNSPPYFLTQSGFVSGGINNATSEQLATADMDKFAGYLTTVVDELEKEHGIQFDTIDPFNEPNTNYWSTNIPAGQTWPTSASRQEGAHIGPQRQDEMVKALAARLADPDTTTDAVISAMDETNPGIFATNWNAWSLESKNAVDQLNVHTYGTGGRQVVRDIAKAADKPLWMSEVEGNWTPGTGFNPVDIGNGLGMAEHIVGDLRELEPDAWVFWQPVEDLYNMEKVEKLNWGSVFIDFDCNADGNSERRLKDGDADPSCKVLTNEKFNTVRNFTHYIEPGDRLVASSNTQSTAAIDADGTGATVVHVNSENAERTVEIDLNDFGTVPANATVTPIVTTQSTPENPTVNALKQGAPVTVNPATKTALLTVPARSVTTFVIDGVSGVADTAASFRNGQSVQLIGVQSGLALDGGSALAIRQPATTGAAAKPQTWTVTSLSGEGTNRHRFTLKNAAGQYLANANGGTALVTSDPTAAAADKNLQWMASTTDGSTYSLLSVGAERVLDVNEASTQPEARVGLWTSNGGGNQLWRLTGTAVLGVNPVTVSTPVGTAPTLPATVTANYAGKTSRPVPVTWQLDGKDWSKAGTVTVRGTGTDIFGAAVEVSATVEVGAYTAARPTSMTVAAGSALASVKAKAPATVQSEVRADGAGFATPVTWAWGDLTDAAFAKAGTVIVSGTATGPSGEKLPARLTVIVTDAVERNVAPQSRPSATYTESGYPVDRTINGQTADKGWSNWRSGTKNAQDTLTYALSSAETVQRVAVQFYRDGGTSWADTLRVDYRSAGGTWTQGALQTVPAPSTGAPKVEVSLGGVSADEVRVVMNARSQTHMVVSEVEIFAAAPSQAGIADLARLTVGANTVDGFDPARTDYTASVVGETWPTLNAQAVDQDAVVRITQPADANGVGTVRVTAPNGTERTYTVTVTRVPAATVTATASSRCVAGKVVVAVTVQNDGATRADVKVDSPYGAKSLGAVEPGKRASATFSTRQASIAAGTATVTATVNGTPSTVSTAIPAATCK